MLTLVIGASFVVTAIGVATVAADALGERAVAAAPVVGVIAGVLATALLAIASAAPGRGIGDPGIHPLVALGARGRAMLNGALWGGLIVAGVRFSAPAFEPLPGGATLTAVLLGTGLATGMYRLHRDASAHGAYRTFNLVAMVLASGSVAAMGATGTGAWWELNFSTLGTSDDLAAACFNVAIIAAGAGMVLMAGRLSAGLARVRFGTRRGALTIVRVGISLLGGSLMGVGFVPIDTDTDLHNLFACGSAGAFAVLSLGVQLWARRMPRSLIVISYAFFATEAAAMVLYDRVGLFNLTVFEIVAFSLVVAWLIALLVCTTGDSGADAARTPAAEGAAAPAGRASRIVPVPALLGAAGRFADAAAAVRGDPLFAPAALASSGFAPFAPGRRHPSSSRRPQRGRPADARVEDEPPDGCAARPLAVPALAT
ncbi:hypothetical protein [Agromyces archimandritae]|uniref:DUF998 domain-containing protein n=1 Tax=Agromyces archimandritae TaxID=2781962 RepID=A0A975FJD2_9MICO|nr:hypothetical protein [Agromyces archimandritae]QTX03585.1 hypothetical protein G127AT_09520 [Agromyces archimandritae]